MFSRSVRSKRRCRIVWAILALPSLFSPGPIRGEAVCAQAAGEAKTPAKKRLVQVRVDPRVELFSIIFCLAGDGVYNMGQVKSYSKDVQENFGPFRSHSVVTLARKLRNADALGVDGPMNMAVHVEDASSLREIVPFEQKPSSLDPRWTLDVSQKFLNAARQFVQDTSFDGFVKEHQPLYRTTESRLDAFLARHGHLEWFDEFFGERPGASYTVVPALLNGGASYGPRCRSADGKESLYCIIGVWETDNEGIPQFRQGGVIGVVVHEFCHSYTNRIVDRYAAQLELAGRKIFPYVAAEMRKQGYRHWNNVMYESLVRACTVRYFERYFGATTALQVIESEKKRQFLWMGGLSKLLAEYETHRDQYKTLDEFMPRIVTFFNQWAKESGEARRE